MSRLRGFALFLTAVRLGVAAEYDGFGIKEGDSIGLGDVMCPTKDEWGGSEPGEKWDIHILNCHTDPKGSKLAPNRVWKYSSEIWKDHDNVHIVDLCAGVPWIGYKTKPIELQKYIKKLVAAGRTNDLVMFTDGDDVMFNFRGSSPTELRARFDAARDGHPVLTMGDHWCWVGTHCDKDIMSFFYPAEVDMRKSTCPRFINSGSLMGKLKAMETVLHMWVTDMHMGEEDDQRGLIAVDALRPGLIKIDYHQKVFASWASGHFGRQNIPAGRCVGLAQCGHTDEVRVHSRGTL